jgi:hypothetical protein
VRAWRVAVVLVVLAGCGGGGTSGAPSDGGDSLDADATVPADGGAEAAPRDADVECPGAVPVDGAACDAPGLWCEYGGGAHSRCSTRASCSKKSGTGGLNAWTVFAPDVPCANIAACPGDFLGNDAGCPVLYGVCDYDAGRCDCVECGGPAGGRTWQWQCRAWSDVTPFYFDAGPADAPGACPPERPRLGTPCVDRGIVCGYDACYGVSLGPYLTCAGGRWAVGPQTDLCNPPSCL